jgi:hypothetical protein
MATPAFPSRPGCIIPFTPKIEIIDLVPDCDIPDPPDPLPASAGASITIPMPESKVGDGYQLPIQIVKAATTESITLSGTQVIDNVSLTAGDLCLVKDNFTAENGVYRVDDDTWIRLDSPKAVLVNLGQENGKIWFFSINLGRDWRAVGAVFL